MDHKLILFTALFLLSMLLYVGLPEHRKSPVPTFNASTEAQPLDSEISSQGAELVDQVKNLRKEQVRLNREVRLLKVRLEKSGSLSDVADESTQACTPYSHTGDQRGLTVFLETANDSPLGGGSPVWTAVTFRNAGMAADGSTRAILGIRSGPNQRSTATTSHSYRQASWH